MSLRGRNRSIAAIVVAAGAAFGGGSIAGAAAMNLPRPTLHIANIRTAPLANATVARVAGGAPANGRNFVLDRGAGQIQFGDGIHGRVPQGSGGGGAVQSSFVTGTGATSPGPRGGNGAAGSIAYWAQVGDALSLAQDRVAAEAALSSARNGSPIVKRDNRGIWCRVC